VIYICLIIIVRKSVAASHARLGLRKLATKEDALFAILLYEESLTERLGEHS